MEADFINEKTLKPLLPLIGDHTPQITEINDTNVTKLTVKSFCRTLTEHNDIKKFTTATLYHLTR